MKSSYIMVNINLDLMNHEIQLYYVVLVCYLFYSFFAWPLQRDFLQNFANSDHKRQEHFLSAKVAPNDANQNHSESSGNSIVFMHSHTGTYNIIRHYTTFTLHWHTLWNMFQTDSWYLMQYYQNLSYTIQSVAFVCILMQHDAATISIY